MSEGVITETVTAEEAGARLDRWVKRRLKITQGQLEKLLRSGQIRVDGARARANLRLEAGSAVRLPPLPGAFQREAPAIPAKASPLAVEARDRDFIRALVIHEDDEMIALNKPRGLAVQGGTRQGRHHLDALLPALAAGEMVPRLVHRLDKDTSGVILLARHPAAAARLGQLFRAREMEKVYWAVTIGVPHPRAGQLRSWLAKGTGPGEDRERMHLAGQGEDGARHAVTDYAVISTAGQKAAWLALRPRTGRTHQLRVHMHEVGTSILGDRKYATRREPPLGVAEGLHLHARALVVPRRAGRALTITADLPPHMTETFATLGFLLEEAGRDPLEPFA